MEIKDKYLWVAAIALGGYAFWMYSKKTKPTARIVTAEERANSPKPSSMTDEVPKPAQQDIVFPVFGKPMILMQNDTKIGFVKSENTW